MIINDLGHFYHSSTISSSRQYIVHSVKLYFSSNSIMASSLKYAFIKISSFLSVMNLYVFINDISFIKVDARGGIEPPIQLLQSRALPLGHPARLLNYDSLLLQFILDSPPSKCVLFTFCPKIFTFLLQKRLYPSLNVEAKPERYSLL